MDLIGRSLGFCHLEFDKKAISDGCRSENRCVCGGLNFKLSFFGLCETCFIEQPALIMYNKLRQTQMRKLCWRFPVYFLAILVPSFHIFYLKK